MPVRRSFLLIAGMIALVAVIFGIYFPVLTRYRNLKAEEESIETKIEDIDKKIRSLNEERDLLEKDRDYIETVIRRELGLVKPGEIIYKFVTDTAAPKKKSAAKEVVQDNAEEPIAGVAPVPSNQTSVKTKP